MSAILKSFLKAMKSTIIFYHCKLHMTKILALVKEAKIDETLKIEII